MNHILMSRGKKITQYCKFIYAGDRLWKSEVRKGGGTRPGLIIHYDN